MRTSFILGASFILGVMLLCPQNSAAQTEQTDADTCVTCHRDTGNEMAAPVDLLKDDVHGQFGFSCSTCHGGDPSETVKERSMDPRKGYIGKPAPSRVAGVCGMCHISEREDYAASVHNARVSAGDANSATCVSCHGAHGIFEVQDSRSRVHPTHVAETCGNCHSSAETMAAYNIPVDQFDKWRASVHAEAMFNRQDLSAPTCNDCHANHKITPAASGMAAAACAGCHVRNAELFDGSPHKDGFDSLGLPSCTICHSNHSIVRPGDAGVGVAEGSTCTMCHVAGDPGYMASEAMGQTLTQLEQDIADSGLLLDRAARAGMEVSSARFDLNGARDSLLNARVVIHGFSPDKLSETTAPGLELAEKAHTAGLAALDELQYRRKGLGISLLVIGLAVFAVYLKIRQIESVSSNTEDQ